MSYKPPASRMRQIKANAPAPIPNAANAPNVMAAIEQAALEQAAGVEIADEIHVPVGIVEVVIKPGEDEVFGTEDDEVSIGPRDAKHDGKHAGRDHGKDIDHEEHDHGEPEVDDDEPLVAEAEVSNDTDADEPAPFDDEDDEIAASDNTTDDDDGDDSADDEGVAADEVSEKPTYDMGMTKKTLLAIADDHGVTVEGSQSKRNIVAALDAHFA